MEAIIEGVTYEAEALKIGPNMAKYEKRAFGLKGPRGAMYYLTQKINGAWFMMSMTGCRVSWPKAVEVI